MNAEIAGLGGLLWAGGPPALSHRCTVTADPEVGPNLDGREPEFMQALHGGEALLPSWHVGTRTPTPSYFL